MSNAIPMNIIAHIRSDLPEKFGIPRQSGIVNELRSKIIFEPEYRSADAVRGLDGYSHIWLLWHFSKTQRTGWHPTVRPPKLGGNTRMGVFATRSPFRPNPIGLSCVKLEKIEFDAPNGPVLHVLGADLMDNTPILDIKPYLAYTDSKPNAASGFARQPAAHTLNVAFPPNMLELIPADKRSGLIGILSQDPRPGYQHDADRVYKFDFAGFNISFIVSDDATLSVTGVKKL